MAHTVISLIKDIKPWKYNSLRCPWNDLQKWAPITARSLFGVASLARVQPSTTCLATNTRFRLATLRMRVREALKNKDDPKGTKSYCWIISIPMKLTVLLMPVLEWNALSIVQKTSDPRAFNRGNWFSNHQKCSTFRNAVLLLVAGHIHVILQTPTNNLFFSVLHWMQKLKSISNIRLCTGLCIIFMY